MNKLQYVKPELIEEYIEIEDICCLSVGDDGDAEDIGISSYKKQNTNCVYTFEQKFHWLIKFIDYIIVRYLSENRISPFSLFFKGLSVNNEINKFDKERDFDLYHFFSHVNEETFIKQIIYIVENVIYHLINKS